MNHSHIDDFLELSKVLRELFMTIAEELGIPKLLDWLAEKIGDFRWT